MPQLVRSRQFLTGLFVVTLGLLAAGILLQLDTQYIIQIDGKTTTVSGSYDSVEAVLAAAGISLRSEDFVQPPLKSSINPSSVIIVEPARHVSLIEDGTERDHWTLQPNLATFFSEIGLTVYPGDQILADGKPIPISAFEGATLPDTLEIKRGSEIKIIDGDKEYVLSSDARTVGEAISEAGIWLQSPDKIEPSLGSWLKPEQILTISRAEPYTILVDGEVIESYSQSNDILDILSGVGVSLSGWDYAIPDYGNMLSPGAQIEVVRTQEQFEIEDMPIPFGSALVASDELEIDQKALLREGVAGNLRKMRKTRIENGTIIEQADVGEWITRTPIDEVIGYGTRIVIRTLDTPDGPQEYWRVVSMRATSYTAASSGKAPDHPAYGVTASGLPAGYGVVAIDPSIVPFRSNVYVEGYGVGFAGDTGGGVKGRIIDLGYDDGSLKSWRGFVDVYFLTPVPAPENINYLIP